MRFFGPFVFVFLYNLLFLLSVLTSLVDLKTEKAYENVLPRVRRWEDSSLLRCQGVPAGGMRRGLSWSRLMGVSEKPVWAVGFSGNRP